MDTKASETVLARSEADNGSPKRAVRPAEATNNLSIVKTWQQKEKERGGIKH